MIDVAGIIAKNTKIFELFSKKLLNIMRSN